MQKPVLMYGTYFKAARLALDEFTLMLSIAAGTGKQ